MSIKPIRVTIRFTTWDEYRVTAPDKREESAYYTPDKEDAEQTARAMYAPAEITIKHRRDQP